MEKINYVGKCLLIEMNGEKVLVVGDIHLGYGVRGEAAGAIVNKKVYDSIIEDFELVFSKLGKVNRIVLLGDLKHSFSSFEEDERYGIVNLLDYLSGKSEEIVVIRGNHDNYLVNLTANRKIKLRDYYLLGEYYFLHGDRDFVENYSEKVKYWVMGHLHPAIVLQDENKREKYKCFLSGKFKDKEVIILPSFSETGGGADVREIDKELIWKFDLEEFKVLVVGENLEILDFGKLKYIP